MALGQPRDEPTTTRFNMAVMGLRLAGRANGVAELHGAVSREMFPGLWPDVPRRRGADRLGHQRRARATPGCRAEVDSPVRRTCIHGVWDGADEDTWDARREPRRRRGVGRCAEPGRARAASRFVRERLGDEVLDPDALTIGFARRFATYKRATLLLSQPDRLRALLARRRPAGAVRVRRQGAPGRPAGQGDDPPDRAVRRAARHPPPVRVPARLRHRASPARCTTAATCG